MYKALATLACVFSIAMPGRADGWEPIPAQVWAMKEDPAKGIHDAVVLESRTRFQRTYVEYLYRVRIFSEAGRRAAELSSFSKDCHSFSGRTVYPDGKVVNFDKRQDFASKNDDYGEGTVKRTVVIPPGVTSDCVMELRWKESADADYGSPLPPRIRFFGDWLFGFNYHTLVQSFEIPSTLEYGVLCAPSHSFTPEMTSKGSMKTFTLRNIPALDDSPFSLRVSADRPHLWIYMIPPQLAAHTGSPAEFWRNAGTMVRDWFQSDLSMGSTFRTWADELISHCTAKTPQSLAKELQTRIAEQIRNLGYQTQEEAAQRPKDQKWPKWTDLDLMVKQGEGPSLGLVTLTCQVLKRAGCKPKVAMVADRDQGFIRYPVLNAWQWTGLQVLVDEPGQPTLWLDPGQRYTYPGFIDQDYQGTNAILFDIASKAEPVPIQVPILPPAANPQVYQYTLTLSEEADAFALRTEFRGQRAVNERYNNRALDGVARNKRLKDRFQRGLKDTTITQAEVEDGQGAGAYSWIVAGTRENSPGRKRTVQPFPGLPSPIAIPGSLPTSHPLPVVMPFLRTFSATSTFRVPKGLRLVPQKPTAVGNGFGEVKWQLSTRTNGEDTEAVVSYQVTLGTLFAGPDNYGMLKEFLAWIETANSRVVVLEP